MDFVDCLFFCYTTIFVGKEGMRGLMDDGRWRKNHSIYLCGGNGGIALGRAYKGPGTGQV